jgi:ABC-type branched-subunit amino acid transport system ATPase component
LTNAPPKLSVTSLNASYGRAHILYDVALNVGGGEAVALVGRNGAGKSTTVSLPIVTARLSSTAGRYRIFPLMNACGAASAMYPKIAASFRS